jgi:hypothetical protein
VYTSSYDCTIRRTSFTSGISTEVFAYDDILISAFDFTKNGHVLWISDTKGGVTHFDTRGSRHEATRFQLSVKDKIGCVSLNPVDDCSLLAASNDRTLKYVVSITRNSKGRDSRMSTGYGTLANLWQCRRRGEIRQ